ALALPDQLQRLVEARLARVQPADDLLDARRGLLVAQRRLWRRLLGVAHRLRSLTAAPLAPAAFRRRSARAARRLPLPSAPSSAARRRATARARSRARACVGGRARRAPS